MNRQAGLRRKACFAFQLFSFWSSNPLQIILILSLTVRFLPKLLRCGSPYKGKPNWLVKRHWLWFDLKPQCLCRFQMFPGYEGQLTKSWPALARLVLLIFLSPKPMDSNSLHWNHHLKEGSHGWQLWKACAGLVGWYMLHLLIFKMNESFPVCWIHH